MTAPTSSVAIVGMAGRFPRAPSIAALWQLLLDGGVGISAFSSAELVAAGIAPELVTDPRYVKARGALDGAEYFDAGLFGILPAEAARLDPQHRALLECAWEALDDAGYGAHASRPRVGVFASASASQYLLHLIDALGPAARDPFALDGTLADFAALRIAYALDLRGAAMTVSTACSSSLVAVHLACQSLVLGELEMAVVGAASLAVPARAGRLWQEGSIVAPDGQCRPFDAAASGTVGGDAALAIVLKRLDDAVRDRDHIHAVIRGTAVNNDGADKAGFTAPSVAAQAQVIRDAHAVAGVAPAQIGYVEAHGSGTRVGDPIEWAALADAFAGAAPGSVALGSIKGNIGHTGAAAGLVGLVKAALCLREGTLVATPSFSALNPLIDATSAPFAVQTATQPWPGAATRLAGVTSLGMGGSNAHAVLEEPPRPAARRPARPWHLVVLSARSRPALECMTTRLAEHLTAHPELPLGDVAHTLQVGRELFEHRRFVVASSTRDAAEALARRDPARVITARARAGRPVAFLYPGLGEIALAGAAELYAHEPAFRAAFDACSKQFRALGVDVRAQLHAPATRVDPFQRWTATARPAGPPTPLAQAVVFSVNWALHALWTSIGVTPDRLAGYSVGEYVAAVAAGVFSLGDALALVDARARLVDELAGGAMTAVMLPASSIVELGAGDFEIAAINGPSLCVAAGPEPAIARLERALTECDAAHRRLDARHAFHTSCLAPAAARLAELVERMPRNPPRVALYANVTGALHDAESATRADYWPQHLVRPVRFDRIAEQLAADPARLLVQVGPGANLVRMVQLAGGRDQPAVSSLPEHSGDGLAHWLHAVGVAWSAGVAVDFARSGGEWARVALPSYPFERSRHWVDAPSGSPGPGSAVSAVGAVGTVESGGVVRADAPAVARASTGGRDERERALLEVWRASFGFDDISVDDDFFALGGHSLLALQLLHRLRRSHGVDLSVRALIEHPTIARLAAHWAERHAPVAAAIDRNRLAAARPDERRQLVEAYVATEVAQALGPAELGAAADLAAAGLARNLADLIRAFKRDLGVVVYPHELMDRASVAGIATLLLEATGFVAAALRAQPETPAPRPAPTSSPRLAVRNPPAAFVLSSARSGSTLLRVMLAGHPRLFCPPELHLLMFATLRERRVQLSSAHFGNGLPRAIMHLLHVDAPRADAVVDDWLARDFDIPAVFRELQRMAHPQLVVDKSPSYAEDPATLRRMDEWFASSYAIVLVRHPCAVMESYVRNRIGSLARTTQADPWRQAEQHWLAHNRNIFEFLDEAPRPAHLVRYEDVVADPERAMRGVCGSLGVEFHPATLTPYEGARMIDGVGDPNLHERDRIEPALGESWRSVEPQQLTDETKRLAARLGYEVTWP